MIYIFALKEEALASPMLEHPQSSPAISSLQRGLTGAGLSTGSTYRIVHPVGSRDAISFGPLD